MAAAKPLPTVLRWQGYANTSGTKWGVPPAILLGLIHEESGGQEGLTSSAGAGGLTQFMPGTARTYGVNVAPGHAANQIDGAAHLLHDLLAQYGGNMHKALQAYAAGPGNLPAGEFYANNILDTLAPLYGSTHTTSAGKTSSSTTTTSTPAVTTSTSSSNGALFDGERRSGALKALLTAGLVIVGAALTWKGTDQLTGGSLTAARHAVGAVTP